MSETKSAIVKKTNTVRLIDLIGFTVNSETFLNNPANKKSLLTKAVGRTVKENRGLVEDYNQDYGLLEAEYASRDDKGHLLINAKTDKYEFTPDGRKKLADAQRALNNKRVVVTCFVTNELPADLTEAWRQLFTPFCIDEEEFEEVQPTPEPLPAPTV